MRHLLRDLVIISLLSMIILGKTSSPAAMIGGLFLLTLGLIYWRWQSRKKASLHQRKNCFAQITRQEYEKRLAQTSSQAILQIMREEIAKKFGITQLCNEEGLLIGQWKGQRLAVSYLEGNYGRTHSIILEREILSVIRRCYQKGINLVRIFCNGEFEADMEKWEQLFGVNLRLYEGNKLAYLLKNTVLFPSLTEVQEIYRREKEDRRKKRRLLRLRKRLFKKTRFASYLMYSLFLLLLARYHIGNVFLNLAGGFSFLGIALFVVIDGYFFKERGDEQDVPYDEETYFAKNGF